VKVDASDPISVGGILLPTSAQKKPTQGEVVALGNAKSLKVKTSADRLRTAHVNPAMHPYRVHVHCEQTGDTVIYSKYAGTEVALEGADYVLLKVISICKLQC
jgi:chaperonin GroES